MTFVFVKKKQKILKWNNFNVFIFFKAIFIDGDIMKCRMCGFEFDETQLENRGCSSCGKHGCNSIHCPNCGFANSPELDQEFEFIKKLKNKIRKKSAN